MRRPVDASWSQVVGVGVGEEHQGLLTVRAFEKTNLPSLTTAPVSL